MPVCPPAVVTSRFLDMFCTIKFTGIVTAIEKLNSLVAPGSPATFALLAVIFPLAIKVVGSEMTIVPAPKLNVSFEEFV